MKKNAFDILKERGFVAQATHEDEIRKLFDTERVTLYIGYDPTADSLHVGHFLTFMCLAHLHRAGHRPITLMGTGTGMIGDPTDRTGMRAVMTKETIMHNISCFKQQISKFFDYENDHAIMEENSWLLELNYIEFMREIGVHFNVNRMLAADSYKSRLDAGLTVFEFNYMLMQAYDFLVLHRKYGCRLQMGGSEQWSNIIAGVELARKVDGAEVYGFTLPILEAADGSKMGKSMGNAVWLDADKTSPHEFYQYWRNTADSLVISHLKLLTFLPMEDICAMESWQGSELNKAKEILAFEVTKTVHGSAEAEKAQASARSLFAKNMDEIDLDSLPTTEFSAADISEGISIIDLLEKSALIPSRGDGRRLIQQGGVKINGEKIDNHDHMITATDFKDGYILIQKGKKVYHRGHLV